jgi:peptide/nickel transport system permease protein
MRKGKVALAKEGLAKFWQRYRKNRAAVIGLALVLSFAFIAIAAPFIAPYDPQKIGDNLLVSPGTQYLMGTDDLGKDIFSGFVWGARTSLFIGFVTALISLSIGVVVGSIAGYFGGALDNLLMRITEFFMTIPRFFVAIVMIAILGPGIVKIILVIAVLSWPAVARLARAEFLSLKERQFVESARAIGDSDATIIFDEILPNASPPLIVSGSLQVAMAILLEAGLSFLGLGDPAVVSWGRMLNDAQRLLRTAWWPAFFPGFGIFLVVLGLNLVGDGLNDALNPRLKQA